MTGRYDCDRLTALAPELALGTAVGEERAKALEHLASCSSCRRLVDDLSSLTDDIVGLAPAIEPPAGFENRVLEGFVRGGRTDRRWLWSLVAALLGALAAAIALFVAFDDERSIATQYRNALDIANGDYFGVRPLDAEDGLQEGYLFIYDGRPSWIFVTLDDSDPGPYTIEVETAGGRTMELGDFELRGDRQSWGTTVDVDMREVDVLRVTDHHEGDVLTAEVSHD